MSYGIGSVDVSDPGPDGLTRTGVLTCTCGFVVRGEATGSVDDVAAFLAANYESAHAADHADGET